jgi:O-antigen ligase
MQYLIKIPLLLVSLVPLFVDEKVLFPSVYTKIFYFSLFVLLATVFFTVNFFANKDFQNQIIEKFSYFKSKIFLALFAFIGISLISTITAFDKYSAFWGNVERGEGFVGLFFLFTFLILLVLNFEKKDWIWFFRLGLIATALMLGKSFIEYSEGLTRPNSFIGNPAFLAGYFLYSVASAFIVLKEDINKWWRYFAVFILPLSFVGVFMTQTRGAMLGFFVGLFFVLIYFVLKGEGVSVKKYNLKNIAKYILGLGLIFVLIFTFTRGANFWQKVPGFSRLANISLKDSTTSSRLLIWESGLSSVDPLQNPKEFLIGWGPDGAIYALGKYYNPLIYKYDTGDFDRAHNKFIDIFIMSGIFALIAYLLVWFFVFKKLFKNDKEFSWENTALIFFFASFFVHLIFVFDQMPTSLILYALLGYVIFSSKEENTMTIKEDRFLKFIPIISALVLLYVFVASVAPAYLNMRKFNSLFKKDFVTLDKNIEKVLSKNNPAKGDLNAIFLKTMYNQYEREGVAPNERFYIDKFSDLALAYGEVYAERNPKDFQFFIELANAYIVRGKKDKDNRFFERAGFHIQKALDYAPKRPDYLSLLENTKSLMIK